MTTKYEALKNKLILIYTTLLDEVEQDVLSGIEDGIYEAPDNEENLALIEEARQVLNEFIKYTPSVYLYIEGGVLQGASATEDVILERFDKDDWDNYPDVQSYTLTEWDEMIKEKTESTEIKGIF